MASRRIGSPPTKRVKLEPPSPSRSPSVVEISPPGGGTGPNEPADETVDEEHCSICLQPFADRTVVPTCSHEFCFECLLIWTDQSRRCPLCAQSIGDYLIHHTRSRYDYQKHYLTPLRASPRPQRAAVVAQQDARRRARTRREREWGRRQREAQEEADELERAMEKRRWIYRHHLYAKHVASNPYTRYRPFPTPAQFSASQDLISRATVFLRRELRVWVGLDVEFLTTFTLSLMKSLDIRSEPAVRLLAEFLDMDSGGEHVNAEHFAHELYSYLRSPYRDLARYDEVVQYDVPPDVPPPSLPQRSRRWRSRSRSVSISRSRSSPSSSPRGASRRPRSPSPLSPRSNGPSHAASAPLSPRPPDSSSASRSRNGGSWPLEQTNHAERRRNRLNDNAVRSNHGSRTAESSTTWQRRRRSPSPRGTHSALKGKERLIESTDGGTTARGEYCNRDAAGGSREQESQSPAPRRMKVDEQHNAAGRSRAGSPVSPTRHSRPALPSSDQGVSSDDKKRQIDTAAHGTGDAARRERSEPTDRPVSSGQDVRRNAPVRLRTRNLLESVQAHLSIHPGSSHALDKPGTLSSLHVTSRGAGGAAKRNEALNPARADRPSLLERLSNTASASPLEEIVRTAADTSGDSPQHDVAVRSPSVVPTQLQASVAATGAEARRSAFDGSSVGMPSARTDEAVPSATSDLRALLLSKLEAEKLNHLESAAATPGDSRRATDRAPSTHELSDCIGPEKEGGVVGAELYNSAERAAEREARLRSQAQLRMRLAAAKKAAASGAGRSSTEVNGGAAHDSGNGGEAQSQEELLRNRLVERRTSSGVDRP